MKSHIPLTYCKDAVHPRMAPALSQSVRHPRCDPATCMAHSQSKSLISPVTSHNLYRLFFCIHTEINAPVAGELYGVGLGLTLLSYNHFIQEPAAASTFAIVSDPHPAHLPDGHCLDYKLIQLQRHTVSNITSSFMS